MRTHPSWGECSAIFTGLGTADYLMNGCYVNVTNSLSVGVNGLWCTNFSRVGTTLAFTVSSQIAAQSVPWSAPFRTAIKLVGLQTNVDYRISINSLPPVSSTNYPNGLIPIKVQTNGTVSLAGPEILLNADALLLPERGTSTCTVALSDALAGNVSVSVSPVSGDTNIVLQGAASYAFGPTNWNLPQTLTFTAPRGTNWQNRTAVFECQAPGYTNRTLTVSDQVAATATMRLTNGSFEIVDVQYATALGGIYHPVGWTNLSGLNIQAASVLAGSEGTTAGGATGNRLLRLVSDVTAPANLGRIAQDLGTMVAGETYTFTADVLGGTPLGSDGLWGATAAFVNQAVVNPGVVYASQVVSNLGTGQVVTGGFHFAYTAQPADQGNRLVLWLQARPVSNDSSATRGGIDNARLTIAPPPVPIPPQPAVLSFTGPVAGIFTLSGATDVPGSVVTQRTTNLTSPIVWTNLQTNVVPGGALNFPVPLGTGAAGYFRLRGQ
jgi:hypothetical protein